MKLICTDVDGTLGVESTPVINSEYYDVIKKLIDKGIIFVVASGRQYSSLQKLFAPIVNDLVFIAEGGTLVRTEKEIFKATYLDKDKVLEMIEDTLKFPECEYQMCTPDFAYVTSDNSKMVNWLKDSYRYEMKLIKSGEVPEKEGVLKFTVYNENDAFEQIKTILPKWREFCMPSVSGKSWIDCVPLSANKGTSVKFLKEKYNIEKEDVLVFGDNMNDIEMFLEAGTSFAVENARPELKEVATNTCDSFENDGVLKTLKEILKTL